MNSGSVETHMNRRSYPNHEHVLSKSPRIGVRSGIFLGILAVKEKICKTGGQEEISILFSDKIFLW
jgi:hypothetical protein